MPRIAVKTGTAAKRAAREAREWEVSERSRADDSGRSEDHGIEVAVHGRATGGDGAPPGGGENSASDKERAFADRVEISHEQAVAILKDIGQQFVGLRKEGRSGAWASLEDKLALNAHVFISAGLMSPKDLIGMMTEIESFRKSEAGTQQAPGDFLSEWLNGDDKTDKKPAKKKGEKAA